MNGSHVASCRYRPGMASGFTLIELMIAVAVLTILIAVALPSYNEQVRKSRRADAQAVLLEAAQFLERFHTENGRYDQDVANTAVALPTVLRQAPKEGATKFYNVTISASAAQTYTLTATPRDAHVGDRCGTMTVNHLGTTTAAAADCWRR
jgi:type IV pilus assembly protein PilE